MNGRYSIRREPDSIEVPFGAAGVAALAALAGLAAGLVLPTAVLESVAFNLYLDQITDLAKPPFGQTARLLAAVSLGLLGSMLGYIVARWMNVGASPNGLSGLLDRLRGVDAADEDDAPFLRRADRHPDAPARRPFSAARDIPERSWDDWEPAGQAADPAAPVGIDDELLLDMMAPEGADAEADVEPVTPGDEPSTPLAQPSPVAWGGEAEPIVEFDLAPPTLDVWEQDDQIQPPLTIGTADAASSPESPSSGVDRFRPVSRPTARRETAPLDLSAGRLDQLIERLEAGLSRKAAAPAQTDDAAQQASDDHDAAGGEASPSAPVEDDPEFPNDPALAAALATLRRMNLRTG